MHSLVPAHLGSVDLVAKHNRRKAAGECRAERAPAAHQLPDRFLAPEAETQGPRGDPRDETVALRPVSELETRHRRVTNRRLGDLNYLGAQSALPARSTAYRCVRSRARSARCSE